MEEVRFLKENLKKRQDDDVVGWWLSGGVLRKDPKKWREKAPTEKIESWISKDFSTGLRRVRKIGICLTPFFIHES